MLEVPAAAARGWAGRRISKHAPPDACVSAWMVPCASSTMVWQTAIRNADAPCLTRDEMIYFIDAFLGPKGSANWTDAYAAPLLGDVRGLPPAFITVAAHDPLYDDGIAFHDRMLAAGNRSELRIEPVLAHSYMRARHHSAPAMAGFRAIVAAIRGFTRS